MPVENTALDQTPQRRGEEPLPVATRGVELLRASAKPLERLSEPLAGHPSEDRLDYCGIAGGGEASVGVDVGKEATYSVTGEDVIDPMSVDASRFADAALRCRIGSDKPQVKKTSELSASCQSSSSMTFRAIAMFTGSCS